MLYGERVGKYEVDLIPTLSKLEAGLVKLETRSFTGKTIKEGLERMEDARAVREVASKYGNSAPETKAAVARNGTAETLADIFVEMRTALKGA